MFGAGFPHYFLEELYERPTDRPHPATGTPASRLHAPNLREPQRRMGIRLRRRRRAFTGAAARPCAGPTITVPFAIMPSKRRRPTDEIHPVVWYRAPSPFPRHAGQAVWARSARWFSMLVYVNGRLAGSQRRIHALRLGHHPVSCGRRNRTCACAWGRTRLHPAPGQAILAARLMDAGTPRQRIWQTVTWRRGRIRLDARPHTRISTGKCSRRNRVDRMPEGD
jgi:hypothetical protein